MDLNLKRNEVGSQFRSPLQGSNPENFRSHDLSYHAESGRFWLSLGNQELGRRERGIKHAERPDGAFGGNS